MSGLVRVGDGIGRVTGEERSMLKDSRSLL